MGNVEFTPSGVLRLCKGPWIALAIGAAATLSAWLIQLAAGTAIIPLALAGVVAAGVGVAIRPRDPTVLITAAVCGAVGAFGLPAPGFVALVGGLGDAVEQQRHRPVVRQQVPVQVLPVGRGLLQVLRGQGLDRLLVLP